MISGFSGILCSYLVPFFALSKPAPLSCSVLRFLIVIISRRCILSSPMSMPLSQRHHCHCHGSHHEQYHRFHRHCHHQGRSGPLPLCLLLCNFHQNKQNIKVCFLRTDENHWKRDFLCHTICWISLRIWLWLTQYHKKPTSTAPYWLSTTMYQPTPPSTDPVPSYIISKCQTFLCPEMSTVVR